jgi:hypothetical protein
VLVLVAAPTVYRGGLQPQSPSAYARLPVRVPVLTSDGPEPAGPRSAAVGSRCIRQASIVAQGHLPTSAGRRSGIARRVYSTSELDRSGGINRASLGQGSDVLLTGG